MSIPPLVPGAPVPSPLDDYLFDLNGFLKIEGALTARRLAELNTWIDGIPEDLQPGDWIGHAHCQSHEAKLGTNIQQIYEAEPFTPLIDNPSWINYVDRYVGGQGGYDRVGGPMFIDENFLNLRGPGQAISLHSGGHEGVTRTQFQFRDGIFHCGQVNILMALTDIGPGDGATMVIPGSHKSNLPHPHFEGMVYGEDSVDGVAGAVEVHLKAGDAILFVDAIAHGSAERVNEGQRRISVFRYGPSWGNFRFGYQASDELLARANDLQRQIVRPLSLIPKPA